MNQYILPTLVTALLVLGGCKAKGPSEPAPLPNMFPSLEALAEGIVEAVQDSSLERLQSYCLTEQEYRDVLWANLPEAEVRSMPVEKAWGWVKRDIEKASRRYIDDFGNHQLKIVKLTPPQEVRSYPNIKVHRAFRITVSDRGADPEEWRLMNVILEYKGWYKVVAYND
ncbi:MAG: hypothetical protein IPP40_08015 [bacterium]|nr:hypothetical protein [bacterium]